MPEPIADLIPSFTRHLKAKNRSEKTQKGYTAAVALLAAWLPQNGFPADLETINGAAIEAFIADQLDKLTPSTAATRYRYLQQFFKWAVSEDIIVTNPMANMSPPTIGEPLVPVLTVGDLSALLSVTEGKGFDNRRDYALFRVFIDTGVRNGEMAGVSVADLDLDSAAMIVTGKGDKTRICGLGDKSVVALDRYLRERGKHRLATLDAVWLARKGALSESGIAQMMRRRGAEAGVGNLHPHRFRHSFAHMWLLEGGNESDLRELAGWSSPEMVNRYGRSARSERAREAHKIYSPGDRL